MNNGFFTHAKIGLKAMICAAACWASFSYAGQDNIRFETIGLEQGLSQQMSETSIKIPKALCGLQRKKV
jgi:hypothetical protein